MRVNRVQNQPNFQGQSRWTITQNVLKAVKNDYYSNPNNSSKEPLVKLLNAFQKFPRRGAYNLSIKDSKLIMTSVVPNQYRNFEPITDSLSESFMRLMGKFINLKSI